MMAQGRKTGDCPEERVDVTDCGEGTKISVQNEVCIQCGACVELCIVGVFEVLDDRVEAVGPDECWACGHCVAGCPVDAIEHAAYPLATCPPTGALPTASVGSLIGSFRHRRSVRTFRDEAVSRSVVGELMDLARWVPSAKNSQPVDWIAIDDPDRIAGLSARTVAVLSRKEPLGDTDSSGPDRLSREHARGNDPIFYRAPVVLIAHVPWGDSFGRDHAAYAAYNVMLAAEAMGLGTCLIGYVSGALDQSRALGKVLGLPAGRRAAVVLALGYPARRFHRHAARSSSTVTWNPPAVVEDGGP